MWFWVAIGAIAAFGGRISWVAVQRAWEPGSGRKRLLAEQSLARELPEGRSARVTGVVRPSADLLEAPLSGRRCVAFRTRVDVRMWLIRRMINNVPGIVERSEVRDFEIECDDGAVVTIAGSHVLLDLDPLVLPPLNDPRRAAFLREHRIHAPIPPDDFEEVVVEPGARVTVAGQLLLDGAAPQPGQELGFREHAHHRRLVGNKQHPILIGKPV